MNYLSVCSGVEAATVAWHKLGWNPVAFSEIEKFPSEVLAHHYPSVPNLGDMSNYKEWNFGEKSIDLLVGGTPCQSFSVAGLRKGLEDPRGNLALIYVGILNKFRPKWFIWENVPGVLSSSKGRDFGSFLGAVGELGYGFSYRVLDAQNFGVPQRRRRVFVVGHFGDWRPAAEVLFEPESLSRHIEESRKKRKDSASIPKGSTRVQGKGVATPLLHQDHIDALCARDYKGLNSDSLDKKAIVEVFENHPADSRVKQMGDTCHSVTARWGTGGGNVPFVLNNPIAYSIREDGQKNNMSVTELDVSNCLSSHQPSIMSHHAQTFVMDQAVAFGWQNSDSQSMSVDTITPTLDKSKTPAVAQQMAVRKLTPIECERLQGFPDGYTNIKENCPDGHRYKAMGNSMAVPVMRWIGKRIELVSKTR
ncbi:DNA cytosine methyltransferase [Methylophilaceae bacterium]|nr:DNA cytosine methyltransferase [Methylophilaceae bacterium]